MIARLVFTYQTANTDLFSHYEELLMHKISCYSRNTPDFFSCFKIVVRIITKVIPGTISFS